MSSTDQRYDIAWLVSVYQKSRNWLGLAINTRHIGQYQIARILLRFGSMTLADVVAFGSRTKFLEWRDELALTSLRAADAHMSRLAAIFAFAVKREILMRNPLEKFGKLYRVDRSEKIWLPEHIQQFNAAAKESLCAAVMLALHTGQRRGDLIALRWSNFDGRAISLTQSKTGARVYVPCTKVLLMTMDGLKAAYMARIEAARGGLVCDHILTNDGVPWTVEAFKQVWKRAFNRSGIAADLHFHDLRGTAVTIMAEAGCTVPEIAAITGHSLATAGEILQSYMARRPELSQSAIAKVDRKAGWDGGAEGRQAENNG